MLKMSLLSTRSGRMVKRKQKADAEYINELNGSNVKATKSVSSLNADKDTVSRRNTAEIQSPINPGSLVDPERTIKDNSGKNTPRLSSVAKGSVPITGHISKEAAVETKIEYTDNEIEKVEIVSPETMAAGKKENYDRETPASAVRRSGRAPVPSSKYKDMELDLTRSKKRLNTAVEVSEPERAKKKRKISDKSDTETGNVVNKSTHSCTSESSEIHIPTVVLEGGNLISNEDEQGPLMEAHLHKGDDHVKHNTELLEFHIVDSCEESAVQENSSSSLHTTALTLDTDPEMKAVYPSIKIGDQQLTFTEHDGETVAVVTISSSPVKGEMTPEIVSVTSLAQDQGVSLKVVDCEHDKHAYSDLVTVDPTIHSSGQVVRRDFVETPFATVIGHDGATYLNLSVEATKISSILKGKHVTASAKSNNPLKGHGRVLRSPVGSMIVKTTLVPPRVTQQEDAKPSVTYSLLGSKKPQTGECAYSTPKSAALPASVTSSHVSQSPQTVVIRQKLPQKTSTLTGIPQVITAPDDNMLTLIGVSHDLPAQEVTSACSSDYCDNTASSMPKTASEILLHKLKLQSNLVNVNEPVQTEEHSAEEPSSNINGIEIVGTVNEVQSFQQDVSECGVQLDISQMSHNENDEVIVESHNVVVDSSSENRIVEINTSELCDTEHAQDNQASTDLSIDTVLGESSQAATEQHIAAQSADQIPEAGLLGSTDISEESLVISTSDALPDISASSSILQAQTNIDSQEIKTSPSSESLSVLAEITSVEQNTLTDRSHLSHAVSNLMPDVGTRKDKFIEKITVVDNGVEYDVRIVSEEEVTEEIIDNAAAQILQIKQSAGSRAEEEPEIKQEVGDDIEDTKSGIEKQSSSTQTVYCPKVQSTSVACTNATTTHTLTTVVEEGSEKKHVYYVSVVPNKGIMAKSKTSVYSGAATWIINDNGMYCCEKCDYQTDRKANFYKHRKSHTGAKPHMCPVCQYKAGTSSNLKRHMGIHKDIREHKCDICSLCFRQKIHLERHIKYKHEEKSIKCPMCDYICANEQPDLKMHIKRKHSNENSGEMINCPECNIQVVNRKDLKQHLKFHRDGPELKLFCKECSFVTDCQSRLKRHTAIHSKMKPFQCGVCNYRAAQKEHVLRHLRTQHKIDIKREGKRPWRRHKKGMAEDGSKERADFTSGDKIFACNHCTMRFAKLINLYKHLHTQHGDIMPAETGGNFYCVVCEFSTTNKKNLLVHMRRHNITDQTPPTHVYSCVMCRYVNPRQRNLFQHIRKKHNMNVSRQLDGADGDDDMDGQDLEVGDIIGTVNQALTPNAGTVSVTTLDMSENTSEMAGHLTSVASVIKIEDLTRIAASGENDGMQTLVIDSNGGADVTEVVHTSTHTAEALEGLQALAEQAGLIDNIIEEQVPVLDEQQTIVIEQHGSTTEVVGTVETVGSLQHMVHHSPEAMAGSGGDGTERLELSEDQLSSLRTGDVVEMEDQLYLVELTQDPSNPHKQVLSFLPVTTATVSQ